MSPNAKLRWKFGWPINILFLSYQIISCIFNIIHSKSLHVLKALIRSYDADLEALSRQQKQQLERAEQQQELDLKTASKKVRCEQVFIFCTVVWIKSHEAKMRKLL